MTQDLGVTPSGPGSREPSQQAVSSLRASIPDVDERDRIVSWLRNNPVTPALFAKSFDAEWSAVVADMGNGWALDFAAAIERGEHIPTASAMSARSDETGTGSVRQDASAVAASETPDLQP